MLRNNRTRNRMMIQHNSEIVNGIVPQKKWQYKKLYPLPLLVVLVVTAMWVFHSQYRQFVSWSAAVSPMSFFPFRKWAYVFLVGACQPENPPSYRYYLYNAIASKYRLDLLGSQADVVVLIQMSVHTKETELPSEDAQLLQRMENDPDNMLEWYKVLESILAYNNNSNNNNNSKTFQLDFSHLEEGRKQELIKNHTVGRWPAWYSVYVYCKAKAARNGNIYEDDDTKEKK